MIRSEEIEEFGGFIGCALCVAALAVIAVRPDVVFSFLMEVLP